MSRLIDADLLKDNVLKWLPKDMDELNDSGIPPIENLVVSLMMEIEEQPTSFDVEAVVKEFEEAVFPMINRSKAIEIVRKGGVK